MSLFSYTCVLYVLMVLGFHNIVITCVQKKKKKRKPFNRNGWEPREPWFGQLRTRRHNPVPYIQPAFSSVYYGREGPFSCHVLHGEKDRLLLVCATRGFLPAWSSQKLWVQRYFSGPLSPNHASRTTKLGPSSQQAMKVHYKLTYFIIIPTNWK